jgi:CRISPR/Cas system-associated exonuclease Cas4 (RecB family)
MSFLDYLSVLKTLRQDGGNRRHDSEVDDEETPDVMRVMTVHASKGLEFPIVYLPGIVKQRFPLQRRSKPVEPPTGMLPAASEGDIVHETGEACLFYVGATRARDHLVLSYAERYGKKNYKRSAYIDDLLAGLSEERIRRVLWQNNQNETIISQNVGAGLARARLSATNNESALSVAPALFTPQVTESTWFDSFSSQPSDRFIETMKPEKLTLSTLEAYLRCPRQYMYSTIYGFQGEKSAYATFWRAAHDTVEELQQKLEANKSRENWDGELITEEETQEMYSQRWRALEGHTFPFAAVYERHGQEVTELIRRKLLASGDTNWRLRQTFTVDIAGQTIEVSVDRVEEPVRDGDPMKFVRTRFGKRKEKPTASAREMLYMRALRQHHPEHNIELLLHNMSTGETYPITLTAKKEQSLFNELEQAVLGLERNEFPAKPDEFRCPACPFFLICPA